MKVLITATSLSGAYGGPAVSVPRLASALAEAGANVALWVAGGSPKASQVGLSGVCCLDGAFADAVQRFGRPDALHDNGLWLLHNHQISNYARRHHIPLVISTRGMLEPWAMRHKWLKKRIAWYVYQKRDILSAAILHTTSDLEKCNLDRLGLRCRSQTIANGVDSVSLEVVLNAWQKKKMRSLGMTRLAVFLGRLYPVKGLPLLLRAWANTRPANWSLAIAGPNEASHREELEALAAQLSIEDKVSFIGPVRSAAKTALLLDADLFVLPSYQESFGIAAAEALAHGVPTITTTGTPWSFLPARCAGWNVSPTVDGLEEALGQATAMSDDERFRMGLNAHQLIADEFRWECIAASFLQLYKNLH